MSSKQNIRFAFLVHPLLRWHRRILGVRLFHIPLILGRDKVGIDGVGAVGRIEVPTAQGSIHGIIVAVPDTAIHLAEDQQRTQTLRHRAAMIAVNNGADTIGLGNALGVLAGRGASLSARVDKPVTTGHASTAWTCAEICERALDKHGLRRQPIGLLGFKGAVGNGIAMLLRARGHRVLVDVRGKAAKQATELGCEPVSRADLLQQCPLLIGASTTGPLLHGDDVQTTQVLVDLALPPTLEHGTKPRNLTVYAGEPLRVPGRIKANFWGRLWLIFARYGRGCIYACFAEPILGALYDPNVCNTTRRLGLEQMQRVGAGLKALGFKPVLQQR